MTPSSDVTVRPDARPTDVTGSSLAVDGLENVFAETVLSGSDDDEEGIEFSYETGWRMRLLTPSAGPRAFPGDALISLLSRHQFGFTRDFLCGAGAHFKT